MADLRITVTDQSAESLDSPLLVLQQFERDAEPKGAAGDVDRVLGGSISRIVSQGDFHGRKDEALVVYAGGERTGPQRVMLVGAGKREDYTLETLRRSIGVAMREAVKLGVDSMALSLAHIHQMSEHLGSHMAARSAAEAALLAAWKFDELRTDRRDDSAADRGIRELVFIAPEGKVEGVRQAALEGEVVGRAANLARTLATRPGNLATPSHLADEARQLADRHELELTVLERDDMEKEGMGALLAVAQGSEEPPCFIVLRYSGGDEGERPLVLVGKGVTFDSGGISIKPSERMEEMKYDMSGAAAVLSALGAVAELKLEANVIGILPCTENLPSGSAMKPGDVIRSMSGKTIEIVNTDAEGRLILADALTYAARFDPAAIVDCATLTGSVVIALGNAAIGLMGNNGDLIDELRAAGLRTGDKCWPLPLWDEYRKLIDSPVADIKNSGGRAAGTITAGWFLKEFVGEVPWAHLDIAGTAWTQEDKPPIAKGATGVPTRLLVEWVRSRAEA
ncbi:MAG TPA: leucyl aminopeptidase [Longimicrobiales bacterium]|nr:leucyl aminopeptidase [Longimicrobiales bacterium]